MPTAETIPQKVKYEIWTEDNYDVIETLIGADARLAGTILQVKTADNYWQDVFPGWAVILTGGVAWVASGTAWRRWFRPVQGVE